MEDGDGYRLFHLAWNYFWLNLNYNKQHRSHISVESSYLIN